MKRFLLIVLTLALFCLPLCAIAEAKTDATPSGTSDREKTVLLPFGVTFGTDLEATANAIGDEAMVELWDEEAKTGAVFLEDMPLGIGSIQIHSAAMNVTTCNSQRAPRMDNIDISIAFEGNCIAAFRRVLADLTAEYGTPDSDPFDEYARASYQEYGNLSASWTTPEVRIYLSLNQAYSENGNIDLSYAYRLCYDLSDLDV